MARVFMASSVAHLWNCCRGPLGLGGDGAMASPYDREMKGKANGGWDTPLLTRPTIP